TNKTPVKELPTTKAETKTTTPADTTKKSPNTGINTAAVSAAIALFAASGVLTVLKKKEK
ncbi:MAG: LPXTG cell wall anchor domain-containing protein, partial [Eubacterium sp.]